MKISDLCFFQSNQLSNSNQTLYDRIAIEITNENQLNSFDRTKRIQIEWKINFIFIKQSNSISKSIEISIKSSKSLQFSLSDQNYNNQL